MNRREYWIQQIQRYADGQLGPTEVAALTAILRQDASLRREAIEILNLDSAIDDYVIGDVDGIMAADIAVLRSHADGVADCPAPATSPRNSLLGDAVALPAGPLQTDELRIPLERKGSTPRKREFLTWLLPWFTGLAATVAMLVATLAIWHLHSRPESPRTVAWLVNAQDCRWSADGEPVGSLLSGRTITLVSGLAEIRFRSNAKILLQGPATIEFVSDNSARLLKGRLAAEVPNEAHGFQVLTPRGKVIDLGTEFGLAVDDEGNAKVVVFQGKINAYSDRDSGRPVNLVQQHAARIDRAGVTVEAVAAVAKSGEFVRAIEPPPVFAPRTLSLDFRKPSPGSLEDRSGNGTGLTHRMPGTGSALGKEDAHLRLDAKAGQLELTTTESDLNGLYQLDCGEYLGIRLTDLGFTGSEDFEITAAFSNTPELVAYNQFGVYAGTGGTANIRGGMIGYTAEQGKPTQFLVNHEDWSDKDIQSVGVSLPRSEIVLTLRRTGGHFSLKSENRTTGASVTLTTVHPAFLDDAKDMYVGIFGANTQSKEPRTVIVTDFHVTVWTKTEAK